MEYELIWSTFKRYIEQLVDKYDDVRPMDVLNKMEEIEGKGKLIEALKTFLADFGIYNLEELHEKVSELLKRYNRLNLIPLLKQKRKQEDLPERTELFRNVLDILLVVEGELDE